MVRQDTATFNDGHGAADFIDMMRGRGASDIEYRDERLVCDRCLPDPGIGAAIEIYAAATKCDFCGRRYRSEKAAPIHEVAAFVIGCLRQDYDIPENVLFYDKEADYGYAGTVYDKSDLIQDYVDGEWDAIEALINCVTDDHLWCESDQALFLPGRRLGASWESFSRYVKHRSRFMFLREDERPRDIMDAPDDTYVPTAQMLDLVGDAVIAAGLLSTIRSGTRLYRARRVRRGEPWHSTVADLGPPPATETGPPAGRMNPAGVPVFYGALDPETPLREALNCNGRVSRGVFSPLRDLRVLDLSERKPVPIYSIFENVSSSARGLRNFVLAFTEDIAKISARDGREHIDYVPAQIVTEYFRRVFATRDDERLDGIVYPSTRKEEGRNVVLFVDRDDVRELSRWGETLRFHPRLTRRFLIRARRGVVTGWTKIDE